MSDITIGLNISPGRDNSGRALDTELRQSWRIALEDAMQAAVDNNPGSTAPSEAEVISTSNSLAQDNEWSYPAEAAAWREPLVTDTPPASSSVNLSVQNQPVLSPQKIVGRNEGTTFSSIRSTEKKYVSQKVTAKIGDKVSVKLAQRMLSVYVIPGSSEKTVVLSIPSRLTKDSELSELVELLSESLQQDGLTIEKVILQGKEVWPNATKTVGISRLGGAQWR